MYRETRAGWFVVGTIIKRIHESLEHETEVRQMDAKEAQLRRSAENAIGRLKDKVPKNVRLEVGRGGNIFFQAEDLPEEVVGKLLSIIREAALESNAKPGRDLWGHLQDDVFEEEV
jgi:hypothetical protein